MLDDVDHHACVRPSVLHALCDENVVPHADSNAVMDAGLHCLSLQQSEIAVAVLSHGVNTLGIAACAKPLSCFADHDVLPLLRVR